MAVNRQHVLRRLIMDEESKIITGLCKSVKAKQAEIPTLKNTWESEPTDSGINLQAESQNTDLVPSQNTNLVPGSGPPPNKRQKTVSEGASEEDEEDHPEEFVDLCHSKDLVPMCEAASSSIKVSLMLN